MMQITVLGSIMVDLVAYCREHPACGETVHGDRFEILSGGKGANQAIGCARMGSQSVMLGVVGNDRFADLPLQSLAGNGVDTSHVARLNGEETGTAFITVNSQADNTIIVLPGANDALETAHLGDLEGILEKSSALVVQLEIPLPVVEYAMRMADRMGIPILLDPAPARQVPDEMLAMASLITPNLQEVETLTGIRVECRDSATRAAHILHERKASRVIVKRGAAGCLISTGNTLHEIHGIPVKAVDTVGAGDCFAAALMVRWLECGDLIEACRFANAAAALKVQCPGAQAGIPSRQAVEALLKLENP